uniref:Uncharacterized protein n=1 Tax=Cacopsylla melanoneura TaxID=428564 RepID=A0A8D8VG82_9HEMI
MRPSFFRYKCYLDTFGTNCFDNTNHIIVRYEQIPLVIHGSREIAFVRSQRFEQQVSGEVSDSVIKVHNHHLGMVNKMVPPQWFLRICFVHTIILNPGLILRSIPHGQFTRGGEIKRERGPTGPDGN